MRLPPIIAGSGRQSLRHALVVCLVAAALALPAVRFPLVWDDLHLIGGNPLVAGPFSASRIFSSAFIRSEGGPVPFYRPLQLTLHSAEHALFGESPWGYHTVGAALHALVSMLVFFTARLLVPGGWGALAGALLFAAHPVHVEAATFVSAQGDLLASVFALAALLLADRAASAREARRLFLVSAAVGGAFLLSLLSKEGGILLPAVLVAWPWLREGPRRELPSRGRVAAALAVSLALGLAAYLALRAMVPEADPTTARVELDIGGAFRRLVEYLRLLLDPTAVRILWPAVDAGWTAKSLVGALLAAASLVFAVRRRASRPWYVFVWGWFVAALVPALRIVPFPGPDIAARYLYLPSAALSWTVAAGWGSLEARGLLQARRALAAGTAVLALLSVLWFREASVWRNEVALFGRMALEHPAWDLPRYNLGNALAAAGRRDEAIGQYEAAVSLNPAHAAAHYNLGVNLLKAGRRHEALPHFETYLKLQPQAEDRAFVEALIARIGR